jgi:hypothetical protein
VEEGPDERLCRDLETQITTASMSMRTGAVLGDREARDAGDFPVSGRVTMIH